MLALSTINTYLKRQLNGLNLLSMVLSVSSHPMKGQPPIRKAERLAALQQYRGLDTPVEQAYVEFARIKWLPTSGELGRYDR